VLTSVAAEALCAWALERLVGTPLWWSALLALPVAAVLLLFLSTPQGVEPAWTPPPEPPSAATHLDASTLAGRLADASGDQGRYRSRVQPRLAAVALAELRSRPGLADLPDLTDPRAVEALGSRWHAVLTDPTATLPAPRELLALLAHLEAQ
jgi:hypothetical protein